MIADPSVFAGFSSHCRSVSEICGSVTYVLSNDVSPGSQLVAFPMFDLAELSEHTDALWRAWAKNLELVNVSVPIDRNRPEAPLMLHWRNPNVLISQTCGYPFAVGLQSNAGCIGTFAYDICDPGQAGMYRSLIVTHEDQADRSLDSFDGAALSINNADSLSGCVSFGVALHRAGVRNRQYNVFESGAHVNSLARLRNRESDLACIDFLTWSLLADVRPEAIEGLAVIGRGPQIPCPPLITALPVVAVVPGLIATLRSTLQRAIDDLRENNSETLRALRIDGFVPFDQGVYEPTVALGKIACQLMPVIVG
jgi:ABC-type phosphate/phosphonate transport system substrate-binding protein